MNQDDSLLLYALDALGLPIFIVDKKGVCVFANSDLFSLVGYPTAEVLNVRQFWAHFDEAPKTEGEFKAELQTTTGEVIPVKLRSHSLPGGAKSFAVIYSSSNGALERGLHSQRLETLGVLAGGIAHDFNNVLTGILGHVAYLRTISASSGPHVESLKALEDGARKAAGMTQQILNFSKLDASGVPAIVDVPDLVRKCCSLLSRTISPAYKLTFDLPLEPIFTKIVEAELAQVVFNLVINARDAIKESGDIGVSVRNYSTDTTSEVCISVRDNGCGMTPEVRSRIFEPFYSTKQDKGTGLGLSTVATIVRNVRGRVEVDSTLGAGTTMRIFVPQCPQPSAASPTSPQAAASGSGRILVVDDESSVRTVLQLSLERLGYTVVAVENGNLALDRYVAEGGFDLVILDMIMPELSGLRF